MKILSKCYKAVLLSPFKGLTCKALQWDAMKVTCLRQKGRKVIDRTKVKPSNTELGPKSRRVNTGEWWPNTQCLEMTLCPVVTQSEYETHAGSATCFALSAGLFLLSWGNTLLSQVNHKATEKTGAGRGPWSWGLQSCLGQALLKAGPATLGCSGPCTVKAWPCPRTQIPQLLWASVPVFDQPYGEQILPKIQLAFFIFHIVPIELCANSERSLAPSPPLLWCLPLLSLVRFLMDHF